MQHSLIFNYSNWAYFLLTISFPFLHTFIPGESAKYDVEFPPCETQHCVNVEITNDLVNEPDEIFFLSLTKISPFINLSNVTGIVIVTDDDGKLQGV